MPLEIVEAPVVANYSDPVAVRAVMRSVAVGRSKSRHSDVLPGDCVTGMFGWQDFAVVDAEAIERKVDGSGLYGAEAARTRENGCVYRRVDLGMAGANAAYGPTSPREGRQNQVSPMRSAG